MGDLSPLHILIIVGVIVVLFGASRLPMAARALGQSMRIFKAETRGLREDNAAADASALPPAPAPAAYPPAPPPAPAAYPPAPAYPQGQYPPAPYPEGAPPQYAPPQYAPPAPPASDPAAPAPPPASA